MTGPVRRRVAPAMLVAVLMLLAGCGAPAETPIPPAPMRILLVGAAGWVAPGQATLADALRRAGNTVVEVSPSADRRSTGTASTAPPETLTAGMPTGNPEQWVVSGTAVDAVLFGLHAVMGGAQPDLVIVGVDPRANVSSEVVQSATVGAALVAAELRLPSVAVSVALRDPFRADPAAYAPVAAFVTQLVGVLSQRPDGTPPVPVHTVLNVNYPDGAARGVAAARTADNPATGLSYRFGARPGEFVAVPTSPAPAGGKDDVNALADGNATLSDLSADPDRTEPPSRLAVRLAPRLHP